MLLRESGEFGGYFNRHAREAAGTMSVQAGSSATHLFRIQIHHGRDSLVDVGLPLPWSQPVISVQNGREDDWMVFRMEWPQRLAPEFAQPLDQQRGVERNHRARAGITSNDGAGFGVVESEGEFCDFLRMFVKLVGEQDFVVGRPNVMDGYFAGRIDLQNFCAPHMEGPLSGILQAGIIISLSCRIKFESPSASRSSVFAQPYPRPTPETEPC